MQPGRADLQPRVVLHLKPTELGVSYQATTPKLSSVTMASSVVFAGTARGVAAVNLIEGTVHKLGLEGSYINHVAKLHNSLAVACPQFGPYHALQKIGPDSHPHHEAGLHLFDLPAGTSSFERTPCSSVWQGDARSCRLVPGQAPSSPPCIFIGTEPADVFVSKDRGQLWSNTQSFASISTRSTWSFPPPPHQPHVLSIEPAELNDGTPAFIAGAPPPPPSCSCLSERVKWKPTITLYTCSAALIMCTTSAAYLATPWFLRTYWCIRRRKCTYHYLLPPSSEHS